MAGFEFVEKLPEKNHDKSAIREKWDHPQDTTESNAEIKRQSEMTAHGRKADTDALVKQGDLPPMHINFGNDPSSPIQQIADLSTPRPADRPMPPMLPFGNLGEIGVVVPSGGGMPIFVPKER